MGACLARGAPGALGGADLLRGDHGDDTILGGAGADTPTGSAGDTASLGGSGAATAALDDPFAPVQTAIRDFRRAADRRDVRLHEEIARRDDRTATEAGGGTVIRDGGLARVRLSGVAPGSPTADSVLFGPP